MDQLIIEGCLIYIYIYIPGIRAVLHSFLAVLSPSIPIIQMINLALCHECKSRLSLPFLILLFGFQPKPTYRNRTLLTFLYQKFKRVK
jgi:hypothetical protein